MIIKNKKYNDIETNKNGIIRKDNSIMIITVIGIEHFNNNKMIITIIMIMIAIMMMIMMMMMMMMIMIMIMIRMMTMVIMMKNYY